MSRGIRMKVFTRRAQVDQAKKQQVEHAQKMKSQKQALIKQYQQHHKDDSKTVKTDRGGKQNSENERRLRQQIAKLERQRQKLVAEKRQLKQQHQKQVRSLRQDNHQLRRQMQLVRQEVKQGQRNNDHAASKLMVEYIEISSWLRTFTQLEIDPFSGKSARHQLTAQFNRVMLAQATLFKILQIAWQRSNLYAERSRKYNRLQRKYDTLTRQLEKLQKAFQKQGEKHRREAHRWRQELQAANLENKRLLGRYVNGSQLDNAFHVMFDQLNEHTIQRYGRLAPLINRVVMIFNQLPLQKDPQFLYGYYFKQADQSYIGDHDGHHLQEISVAGVSLEIRSQLQTGIAIKVEQRHHHLINTMPWVNELFQYLDDNGSFRPNELVSTTGTVKLSKLLSDGPDSPAQPGLQKIRVIMGKVISLSEQGTPAPLSQEVKCLPITPGKRVINEKVEIVNPDKLAWLYSKNLLLIGNKKIMPLVNELRKYVNLSVMDAYEDSLELIFTKIHAADYVFVLIGSVPHALTDYLKNHSELDNKIQYFYRANPNEGVRRLNYLYMNRR